MTNSDATTGSDGSHGTNPQEGEDIDFVKSAEMKDSYFPGDWDEEDIEFLAQFLSDHKLGELGSILNPEHEYDYRLYTPAQNDDDEEIEHTADPLDVLPESNLDTPGTEFSNLPRGTGGDAGGGLND